MRWASGILWCRRFGLSRAAWPNARAALALCAALAAPSAVFAQVMNPLPQPQTAAGPPYAIEGRVVSQAGRSPVDGVRVTLSQPKAEAVMWTLTDSEGGFAFYRLMEGHYTVHLSHPSFEERSVTVDLVGGSQREVLVELVARSSSRSVGTAAATPVWAMKIPQAAQKKYSAAIAALRKGDRKKCIAELESAIALYPDYAGAYAALGSARLSEGDAPAAIAAFEKALEIDEALPEANFGLGALLSGRREFEKAETLLLRAAQSKPGDWHIAFELGQLYVRRENFSEAEAYLRKALALRDDHARSHLLLINALAMQEKLSDALARMDDFLARFPNDPFAPQVSQKRDALRAHLSQFARRP